jgi:hypothetical protein
MSIIETIKINPDETRKPRYQQPTFKKSLELDIVE